MSEIEKLLKNQKAKLHSNLYYEAIASKIYQDSISKRIKGFWRQAGDLLIQCGDINFFLKNYIEAATVYTESAESYLKIDKAEAFKAYTKAIKTFCDMSRFNIAGRLERKVASLHWASKHWEDAAFHYRKAANFLSGENLLDQSDYCMERCAESLIRLNDFTEASRIYEMVGRSCASTNLRRFNARDKLLMALLCLFAIPHEPLIDTDVLVKASMGGETVKGLATLNEGEGYANADANSVPSRVSMQSDKRLSYMSQDNSVASSFTYGLGAPSTTGAIDLNLDYDKVMIGDDIFQAKYQRLKTKCTTYDSIDLLWKVSKEQKLIINLVDAALKQKFHEFIDQIYYWNDIFPFSELSLKCIKLCTDELQAYIKYREDFVIRKKEYIEKQQKEAEAAAKALLEELTE